MSIRFVVFGTPVPQGSKVRTRWGMREANERTMPWREATVAQIVRDGLNDIRLTVPVCVRATFYFERPKSHYGTRKGQPYLKDTAPLFKVSKPDLDKLQRNLGDALAQSGVLVDDDQIVQWMTRKVYSDRSRMEVEVLSLLDTEILRWG